MISPCAHRLSATRHFGGNRHTRDNSRISRWPWALGGVRVWGRAGEGARLPWDYPRATRRPPRRHEQVGTGHKQAHDPAAPEESAAARLSKAMTALLLRWPEGKWSGNEVGRCRAPTAVGLQHGPYRAMLKHDPPCGNRSVHYSVCPRRPPSASTLRQSGLL
jgi:hypothetical protein